LTEAGLDVQLEHDQAETEGASHGYVGVKLGNVVVCEEAEAQHNRSYGNRSKLLKAMAETVIEAAQKQAGADAVQIVDVAAADTADTNGAAAASTPSAAAHEDGATCLLQRPQPTASL